MGANAHEISKAKGLLANWLEQGREALAHSARSLRLSTTVITPIPVVQDVKDHGTGFSIKQEQAPVNVLDVLRFSWAIYDRVQLPDPAPLQDAATILLNEHGSLCQFWSSFAPQEPITQLLSVSQPDFNTSPADWLIGTVFGPLLFEYAARCSDLGISEPALRNAIIEQAFRFLAGTTWAVIDQVPVAGLLTPEAIAYKNITLRPMTGREIGTWISASTSQPTLRGQRWRGMTYMQPLAPTHLLEIRTEWVKTEQPLPENIPQRLLLALQLLGFQPASLDSGEQTIEPGWAFPGRMSSFSGLPKSFVPREIRADDLEAAWTIAQQLKPSVLRSPGSSPEVAVHRFHLALRRDNVVDRLIDLTIALEALLLPGIDSELSFRFRLHGALWIEADPTKRSAIEARLKEIYKVRSKLVHGDVFPRHDELKTLADDAQELTRAALRKALKDGWPTAKTFNELCLGKR